MMITISVLLAGDETSPVKTNHGNNWKMRNMRENNNKDRLFFCNVAFTI